MSMSDLERFVTDANNNVAIQNDLLQRVEVPAVVEVAQKHGYNVTAEDVQASTQSARTFRITNIRANANQLTSGGPTPGTVQASVTGPLPSK